MRKVRKILTFEEKALVRELIWQGVKYIAIAAQFDIGPEAVNAMATKMGHRRRVPKNVDKELMWQLIQQGVSYTEIAKRMNVSRGYVGQIAREHGVYVFFKSKRRRDRAAAAHQAKSLSSQHGERQ